MLMNSGLGQSLCHLKDTGKITGRQPFAIMVVLGEFMPGCPRLVATPALDLSCYQRPLSSDKAIQMLFTPSWHCTRYHGQTTHDEIGITLAQLRRRAIANAPIAPVVRVIVNAIQRDQ